MAIRAMDHFTILTDRLDETLAFYTSLGLADGARPDFGFGGAWLYASDRAVLHIVEVRQMPEVRRGVLDHMAFRSEGLLDVANALRTRAIPYRIIRTPRPFSRWQMFLEDPNGVEVELDFDIAETPPEDWKMTARLMTAPTN
jgi:catechol 2,3-dioxygenase-like lactoylglutathione lyase family enzyme